MNNENTDERDVYYVEEGVVIHDTRSYIELFSGPSWDVSLRGFCFNTGSSKPKQ